MPNQDFWIIFKTKKQGNEPKQLTGELKEVKKGLVGAVEGLTGMSIAGLGLAGVIAGVGKGLKDSLDSTVAYAEQVRDLGRISGASAEDTSRLIQTADDLKVEYGTLMQAAKALAKDGIALTTEELAKSADEYLAITDAGGRAEYATQKFGKAGLELTKVLEQGGDAIRTMAAEQSGALILSQKQVDEARRLEKAQDAVDDSFTALKLTIGNKVIPVVADLLGQFDDLVNGEAKLQQANVDTSKTFEEYTAKIEAQRALVRKQDPVLAWIQDLTKSNQGLTETEWKVAKGMFDIQDEGTRMQRAMELNATASDRLNESLEKNKTKDLAVNMQEYSKQLLFNQAAAGLDADASLILAEKFGLIYGKTKDAMGELAKLKQQFLDGKISAQEYADQVARLNDRMSEIKSKTVTIEVLTKYTELGVGGGPQSNEEVDPVEKARRARQKLHKEGASAGPGLMWHWDGNNWSMIRAYASGGLALAGEMIMVGEQGPEWFVPKTSGTIINNEQMRSITNNSSSRSVIFSGPIYINNGMDLESFRRMLVRATR